MSAPGFAKYRGLGVGVSLVRVAIYHNPIDFTTPVTHCERSAVAWRKSSAA